MMDMKTKQSENKVNICGTLLSMDVTLRKTRDGRDYAMAKLSVRVDQDINGKEVECTIPVRMFAMKNKKDGSVSPIYDSIAQLPEKYTSLASCPEDHPERASRVNINGGRLKENMWVNKEGNIISTLEIETNYIHDALENAKDCANFECVGIVLGKDPEIDKNTGEETGRLKVAIGLVQWGGVLDRVEMIAESQGAVSAISSSWNNLETVAATGQLRILQEEHVFYEHQGFGPDIMRTERRSCREVVITGGSPGCLDEVNCYDVEDIRKAIAERTERRKALTEQNQQHPQNVSSTDFGF